MIFSREPIKLLPPLWAFANERTLEYERYIITYKRKKIIL
jgi:hypothetical protein